jgi:hypothetical protein
MVEIAAVASALVQPNLVGTILDFSAQVQGLPFCGIVRFLSHSVFHHSSFLCFFLCAGGDVRLIISPLF